MIERRSSGKGWNRIHCHWIQLLRARVRSSMPRLCMDRRYPRPCARRCLNIANRTALRPQQPKRTLTEERRIRTEMASAARAEYRERQAKTKARKLARHPRPSLQTLLMKGLILRGVTALRIRQIRKSANLKVPRVKSYKKRDDSSKNRSWWTSTKRKSISSKEPRTCRSHL